MGHLSKGLLFSTDRAVKLRVEGAKTPAPPLQLTPLGVQGHSGARFVPEVNAIILIEAIFEFPSYTRDMEEERIIFDQFLRSRKSSKMTSWS